MQQLQDVPALVEGVVDLKDGLDMIRKKCHPIKYPKMPRRRYKHISSDSFQNFPRGAQLEGWAVEPRPFI